MYGHTIMRLHFSEQNCLMVNQIQYLFTMFHMIQNITGITEYHSMISLQCVIQYSTISIQIVYFFALKIIVHYQSM